MVENRQKGQNMKEKKSRIFFLVILSIYIICLVSGIRVGLRRGVDLGDVFFYKKGSGYYAADRDNQIRLSSQGQTEHASIVLNGKAQEAELSWKDSEVKITYGDGTVTEGTWGNDCLLDKEGMPVMYSGEAVTVITGGGAKEVRKEVLSDALCRVSRGAAEMRGSVWFMMLGTVLYGFGVFALKNPESSHFFLSRWRYRNAELSEEGKVVEQIGGAVFLIFGTVLVSGVFLLV